MKGSRRSGAGVLAGGVLALALVATEAAAQIKAFPQAEGFGKYANGGRGGDVYHVTKLTDDGSFGTLRYGIDNAPTSGRTIVFDVSGWIDLGSKLGINSNKRNITIAGQTAPGGGIGVRGDQFSVGGDDIVVRHMRFRPGKGAGRVDAAGANSDAERVIYDHISAGFSYDETFSTQATDLTLQYSSVAFGLETHSAGSLLENPTRVSMHHNLYAHNNTRNPKHRVKETLDWVNNVIYNWDNRAFYMEGTSSSGFFWTSNVDGNYFIAGPNQDNTKPLSGGSLDDYGTWVGVNAYDDDQDAVHDGDNYERSSRNFGNFSSALTTWSDTPYPSEELWKSASPQDAYDRVLAEFGATPWNRDEVDVYTHNTVVNRNGAIIERESDLPGVSNGGFGTLAAGVAPTDTDRDGMPDEWEQHHGANPLVANNNADYDQDGYTDLEEYLNDLGAFKAVGAVEFNGIGRYADWSRWTHHWEPSRLDEVVVAGGAAFVDAVGQRAGTLSVTSGGRFYVTSGWIEVSDSLVVSLGSRAEQRGGETRVGGTTTVEGDYRLRGGELLTSELVLGAGSGFEFTGGVLATEMITGDLVNDGGRLEVGIDQQTFLLVTGDLELNDGELAIELAGGLLTQLYDTVGVSGDAVLGGALEVSTVNGFTPSPAERWPLMTAASFSGSFDSITAGYSVELIDNTLWLVSDEIGVLSVPEPTGLLLAAFAAAGLAWRPRRVAPALLAVCVVATGAVQAASVSVIADTQLSENGSTGQGDATDAGGGSSTAINARWNNGNRNEWIALKFDLGAFENKNRLVDLELRTTMHRASVNNTQTLRLYALNPGVAGEDWDEATTTYGSMPGFTFDGFSQTRDLDTNFITDLGAFGVSGYDAEGSLALINPESLTTFVNGMGDNDLLTLLIGFDGQANGQWRIASRETTTTDSGVLNGSAGDFAARLDFDVTFGGVLGDYNDDGLVDAADYIVWRNSGPNDLLPNEEVSPGVVDIADFLFWKERFGATDTGQPAAVPEPAAALLAALAAPLWVRPRSSAR